MKRIMVIVWKWEDLADPNHCIDEHFPVHSSPDSSIIRINELKSPDAFSRLSSQINESLLHGKVIAFLHREHGYSEEDIEELYQLIPNKSSEVKYFLFGEGEDYLYYAHSEQGMLDDFGGFMDEPEFEFNRPGINGERLTGIERVSVLRENGRTGQPELRPYYFDKVWEYYQNDFIRKIHSLKLDLLNALFPYYLDPNPKEKLPIGELLNQQNKELYLTLHSFCKTASKQPVNRNEDFTQLITNVFKGNLRNSREKYLAIKQTIEEIIFAPDSTAGKVADLEKVRNGFDELLNTLPQNL